MNKEIPYGYCKCGCGQKVSLATYNRTDRGWIKGEPVNFIFNHHMRMRKREKNNNWKGGVRIDDYGYKVLYMPDHERSGQNGYVKEHIFIAQKVFGKSLPPKAVVHHHTKVQFVICEDQEYHMLLHLRERAILDCGHADWRKCNFCKRYDAPGRLYISPNNEIIRHKNCFNEYQNRQRAKRLAGCRIYQAETPVTRTG